MEMFHLGRLTPGVFFFPRKFQPELLTHRHEQERKICCYFPQIPATCCLEGFFLCVCLCPAALEQSLETCRKGDFGAGEALG